MPLPTSSGGGGGALQTCTPSNSDGPDRGQVCPLPSPPSSPAMQRARDCLAAAPKWAPCPSSACKVRVPCPPSLSPFALQSPLKHPAPAPAPLTLSTAFPTGGGGGAGTLLSGSSSFSSVFTLLPPLATFFSILTAPGPTVSK